MISRRLAAALAVAGWLATPAPTLACSCMGGLPVCEQFWVGADEFPRAIFEATVVSIADDLGPEYEGRRYPIKRVTLASLRGWSGTPVTEITTGAGGGDCGYRFEVGRRYVIDGIRNPSTGLLSTGICSLTKPIEEASELLAFLASLSEPSPGGRVFGVVERSSGSGNLDQPERTPLHGVRLLLNGPRSASTLSGVDGAFSFDRLPPGSYQLSFELEGRPELRVPPPDEFTIANAHACHRAWVNFPVNGVIEGTVVDPAGRAVADVEVGLRPESRAADGWPRLIPARSDELGRFTFDELSPGRYVVAVSLQLGPNRRSPYAVTYAVDAAGAPAVVEIGLGDLHQLRPMVVVRLESTTVAGQVVWTDGTPAAGCAVSAAPLVEGRPGLGSGAPETGADGRFQLEVFSGIPYRVRAGNCTQSTDELDFVPGDGAPLRLVVLPRQ